MTDNLDVIYLFGFSSNTGKHLERLLSILQLQKAKNSNIGLVLIQDGVIGITIKGKIPNQMKNLLDLNITMFAMIPDLKARGIALDYINEKIRLIEYSDLIDILDTTPKIISWM